jgi:dienelactone hydrolase
VSATPAAVRVVDVALTAPGQADPVRAWLVTADDATDGRPRAGVLWLHWLGHRHNDRNEFLPLAVELASRGVVSLLPAGFFPWVPDPDGTATDAQRVRDQVAAHAVALDLLCAQPGVDAQRIALVGHDYGGMYGALLADQDERITTLVLQAADATWSNWFSSYWLKLEGAALEEYDARFAGLDPVEHVARLGDRLLLQWAGQDTFVTEETRTAYATANPRACTKLYDRAEHMLDDHALADLREFLVDRLGLAQN